VKVVKSGWTTSGSKVLASISQNSTECGKLRF
jgi:hypothetical protein